MSKRQSLNSQAGFVTIYTSSLSGSKTSIRNDVTECSSTNTSLNSCSRDLSCTSAQVARFAESKATRLNDPIDEFLTSVDVDEILSDEASDVSIVVLGEPRAVWGDENFLELPEWGFLR